MFELSKGSSKKNSSQALKRLNEVSHVLPNADVVDIFSKLTDAYVEHKVTERELAKIQAQKEFLLTEIEKKYDLYRYIFEQLFNERKAVINKSFEIIDKGLKENDKELISTGMQGLSKIVSTSPFANLDQLTKTIEGNRVIEI
ncbi:hypothetical protein [Planomicrobium sp. CPCC 101110]|uniref:hypothetical protein n=1 Tax=Planomicrobium sp. CPCC 101110 TaxID=2599619 RepID=UPI0011B53919|nr:hypothetical protein [Planomicrobium sp. CPCC 101110]TWT27727.1 hypothetical protein FQV30_04225 [Planomicrobium sp. CPCC 101110]